MDEGEIHINDLEHKEKKQAIRTTKRKQRIPQNEDNVSSLYDNFSEVQCLPYRDASRRRERARN